MGSKRKIDFILEGMNDMFARGCKYSVKVEVISSRNYAYMNVSISFSLNSHDYREEYGFSTLNFEYLKGSVYAGILELRTKSKITEAIERRAFRANSNLGQSLFTIVERYRDDQGKMQIF